MFMGLGVRYTSLFADDCIIYKTITVIQDAEQLQDDLHKICEGTNKWQIKLNVIKLMYCIKVHLLPVTHTVHVHSNGS